MGESINRLPSQAGTDTVAFGLKILVGVADGDFVIAVDGPGAGNVGIKTVLRR